MVVQGIGGRCGPSEVHAEAVCHFFKISAIIIYIDGLWCIENSIF